MISFYLKQRKIPDVLKVESEWESKNKQHEKYIQAEIFLGNISNTEKQLYSTV